MMSKNFFALHWMVLKYLKISHDETLSNGIRYDRQKYAKNLSSMEGDLIFKFHAINRTNYQWL